MVERRGRE